ncbi:MAG: hypothetical protein KAW12_09740 [Candidatus Aminicenantes bacterium]|nr:hypothetical protein [Candidatus Aminicenantes bacterium]
MFDNELKIAIIGGGPAGSFTCHFLNKLAAKAGKKINITIYDHKCFSCTGQKSCNMCAGIISHSLINELEKEKIFLPASAIKNEIKGYQLHSKHNKVYFKRKEIKRIYSVFRGQGPLPEDGRINSFDQFLLDFVSKKDNVSIIKKKVPAIDFSQKDYVQISTSDETTDRYDFVIAAFGVNTRLKKKLTNGYKPPRTIRALQLEIKLPLDFVEKTFMEKVQMFPIYKNNIRFLTLTPKWDFITVTAIGKNVKLEDVKKEIQNNKNIRHYLPQKDLDIKCMCAPEMPVNLAKKPYGDRFLAVGDACVSRYLKNGIESAFHTAFFAAAAIINHGTDKKTLRKHYYRRCKKEFHFDNLCGKFLFVMDRLSHINVLYAESHMMLAKKEQVTGKSVRLSGVLWDMFTGHERYKVILRSALNSRLIFTIIIKEFLFNLLKSIFKGKAVLHLPLRQFYKLLNGSTVAIIGGGPAGAACAIKLAKSAKEQGRHINIVLYEGKDFYLHHNQCVGILSPPLLKILQRELDIKLPEKLIKSEVPGYELHTDKESIFLKNYRRNESKTYSVRRSELDNFLLNQAREQGVKVIGSRVTDIEFCKDTHNDEVRIFSESDYLKADAVVCAFGLDEEMMTRLRAASKRRFRSPRKIMKTFVTRIDFPEEVLNKLYDKRVYPFLISSLKRVEFGAVTIKDDHIVINAAGEKITSDDLLRFLSLPGVIRLLPGEIGDKINCFCGRFPSSPARKPYGDRYVAIGDATGWLRPLKGKGINLAVITGIHAAQVMLDEGISKKDFARYRALCRGFIEDYKYGVLVSIGLHIIKRFGILDFFIRRARKSSRFYKLLYDAVSAENSYKNIMLNFLRGEKPPTQDGPWEKPLRSR